jgi:hypothetical protein
MPPVRFEPTISAGERPKTYARPMGPTLITASLKLKVKVALRGLSTPQPLGSIVFLPQQVTAFISRGATHHTDARDLYQ